MDPAERGDEHAGSPIDAAKQIGGGVAKEILEIMLKAKEQKAQIDEEEKEKEKEQATITCQLCEQTGHTARECPQRAQQVLRAFS